MTLRQRLADPRILLAPGVYDALSALLVEQAGFEAAFVSGASLAYTQLGRPDIGLVTLDELTGAVARIADRVDIPLIVDADTGFGNAANVALVVRRLCRAGAMAIQLEDQTFPKRCGHLNGKSVIPTDEMVGKIKAALDARLSPQVLIAARTDAIAVEGFEAALARAEAYVEAGCDILFIEAPQSDGEFRRIGREFKGRAPLLANMVEGGRSPLSDAAALEAMGFSIALFPGALVRVTAFAAQQMLSALKRDGATRSMMNAMHDLKSLNDIIGAEDLLDRVRRYDPTIAGAFGAGRK
jgi:2-methylisocitrate lyase-like PEP mutase family enzyme